MRKLFVVLGLVLCAEVSQAQTCTVQLATAQSPNQVQLSATETGTAVGAGKNISGGGKGPVGGSIIKSTGGFTFASAATMSGDFTFISDLAGLSGISGNGGTELGAGAALVVMEGGLAFAGDRLLSWGIHSNSSTIYLELNNGTTKNSSQWLSRGNIFSQVGYHPYLKIQRTGSTYTFSDSSDAINWTQHATAQSGNGGGSTAIGLGSWSGDTTGSSGTGVFMNTTLNGSAVSLTDMDYWTTGGVTGSVSPQVQPGTLTFGPDVAFGKIIYSFVGTGCDPTTVAGLQSRVNNSQLQFNYSISILNNGVNIFAPNWNSPAVCVTCQATDWSTAQSLTLVSGQTYYVTKRVDAYFFDGTSAWASTFLSAGGDPIVQQIILQP